MRSVWLNTAGWVGAATLAVALALVAPSESSVMGRLPPVEASPLFGERQLPLPSHLPGERTLALVTFEKGHRQDVQSWIDGLQLRDDRSIAWLRMPVIEDPGSEPARRAVQTHLAQHYSTAADRLSLLPVFTKRTDFARATGIDSTEEVAALVVDRSGAVLARVQGRFDAQKAESLRATLLGLDDY